MTKKQIPAWFFKITAYADQLLADLSEIDWPPRIKLMQENWIGRSTGTDIVFTVDAPTADGGTERVEMPVFTTRPDTVFGVTFMVLAPEHELVQRLTTRSAAPPSRPTSSRPSGSPRSSVPPPNGRRAASSPAPTR